MSCSQLVTPNLDTAGNVGWCLAFAESAFGTPHLYPNAYTAWEATQSKHEDENFPDGMYVPIWFSYVLDGVNLGHVAIRMPDGRILSSPWQSGTTQAILPSIAEMQRIYSNNGQHPLTYLGWSEDLAGRQLIEITADTPPPPPYTVTETYPNGRQVKLNKQPTYLWGMNYTDFDYMCNNPVETHDAGEVWTVTNKVHHQDGYDYYRRDGQVDGFNVLDCDDYTPPPPPPAVPQTIAPSAAPVPYTPAEKYKVVTTLLVFPTDKDAMQGTNAQTTLAAGTYYVTAKQGKAYNLSTSNMQDQHKWVNTIDNVLADIPPTTRLDPPEMTANVPNPIPPPADLQSINWRGTINLGYAGMYVFYNHNKQHDETADTVEILDLDTGNTIKKAENGQYSQFSGKVKWTDGNWYGRLKDTSGHFKWYATRIEDLVPYNEFYSTKTTLQERQVLHTLTAADRIELWLAKIKTLGTGIWDVLYPK